MCGCVTWVCGIMRNGGMAMPTLSARMVDVCLDTSSIDKQYFSSSLAATSFIT